MANVRIMWMLSGLLFVGMFSDCWSGATGDGAVHAAATEVLSYRVINTFPHDPMAFTQGLIFDNGVMYEGTGLRGRSTLRRVDLETGVVAAIYELSSHLFGEGITVFGDRIMQLTWQSNIGFVYDKESFEVLDQFSYPTEGWGITHDGEHLIMSDGTADLHFLDPDTFAEVDRITVRDDGDLVTRLNELEYIGGRVYANIWQTDRIARIDPGTGQVIDWIDLTGLLTAEERQGTNVLNGIAFDAANNRLFVTGKLWPKLFEIAIIPEPSGLVLMAISVIAMLSIRPVHGSGRD